MDWWNWLRWLFPSNNNNYKYCLSPTLAIGGSTWGICEYTDEYVLHTWIRTKYEWSNSIIFIISNRSRSPLVFRLCNGCISQWEPDRNCNWQWLISKFCPCSPLSYLIVNSIAFAVWENWTSAGFFGLGSLLPRFIASAMRFSAISILRMKSLRLDISLNSSIPYNPVFFKARCRITSNTSVESKIILYEWNNWKSMMTFSTIPIRVLVGQRAFGSHCVQVLSTESLSEFRFSGFVCGSLNLSCRKIARQRAFFGEKKKCTKRGWSNARWIL